MARGGGAPLGRFGQPRFTIEKLLVSFRRPGVARDERPARLKCFQLAEVRGAPRHVAGKPLRLVPECSARIGIDGQLIEIFTLEDFQRLGQPAVIELPRLQGQDQPRGAGDGFRPSNKQIGIRFSRPSLHDNARRV